MLGTGGVESRDSIGRTRDAVIAPVDKMITREGSGGRATVRGMGPGRSVDRPAGSGFFWEIHVPDDIRDEPHYEISSPELAAWLDRQGDAWWSVDGDPLLTGLLAFPSPGDELAAVLRRLDRPLLVQDRRAEPKGKGERIDSTKLDELATTFANNVHLMNGGAKPAWADDRLFFFSWKGSPREWMLVEDSETAESSRQDAATAGKQ
jgi:hypothetical protein